MKGNINMEKQKRITLNADKRKVIADIFQQHFELSSKWFWKTSAITFRLSALSVILFCFCIFIFPFIKSFLYY